MDTKGLNSQSDNCEFRQQRIDGLRGMDTMEHLKPEQIEKKRGELMQGAVNELRDRLQRLNLEDAKRNKCEDWIDQVFQEALAVSASAEHEPLAVEPLQLPLNMCECIIDRLMDVLGYAYAFQDSGLYYLNDVGTALGFKTPAMRSALDRKLESLRDGFSKLLLEELDAAHRHWCAVIILKTILADGVIHPSEKVYFKVINTLISDDPKKPEELIAVANRIDKIPDLNLDSEIVRILMWHVVAIAMFDGEYVGQEADFVKKTAAALQIDPAEIDEFIQPVAATFMVIEALFPSEANPG